MVDNITVATGVIMVMLVLGGITGCTKSDIGKDIQPIETQEEKLTGAVVGANAPEIELKALDGKVYSLEDYKGKPVVVSFFTTT